MAYKSAVCVLHKLKTVQIYFFPERFINQLFLYAKQPQLNVTKDKIKKALRTLVGSINTQKRGLESIADEFLVFIDAWLRGWLNGNYTLTKTHVLKKITEILLGPFMMSLNEQVEDQEAKKDEKTYSIWNDSIAAKDVIIVNESDETVHAFMQKYIYKSVIKHKWSDKDYKTVKRDLMKNLGESEIISFLITYEYLWKTRQIPLVIEVTSENEIEDVGKILKISRAFRVIILNKTKITVDYLGFKKMLVTASHLTTEQQKDIFNVPITLQGRSLKGFGRLNPTVEEIHELQVKDIIYILCNQFNIGGECKKLPHIFIDISLKRVWLKKEVLKKVQDVFVICCESVERFKNYIITDCGINDLEIIESTNIKNSNPERNRIVLYKSDKSLKTVKHYFQNSIRRPIHFLVSHGHFKLEWINSWGTIMNLERFRESNMSEDNSIEVKKEIKDFCTKKKSVIISSNAGMGKTVLIDYFARNAPVNFWVVKINLELYKSAYKNIVSNSEGDSRLWAFFGGILEEECSTNLPLAKAIFRRLYQSKNIVALLDGFDEISIEHQRNGKRFIELLSGMGCFVLVTTRPVLQNVLESTLKTFSLDLNPFSTKNQEYFLEKTFYNQFSEIRHQTEDRILYLKRFLSVAQDNLNDNDNEFTGIPLQMLLLSQVCLEDFKSLSHRNFNPLRLYRNLIEKNIEVACEKFGENMIQQFKACRAIHALPLLYSKEILEEINFNRILENLKFMMPDMLELIQKDGLTVTEQEDNVRFIHPIYAEYSVGEWLAKNIKGAYKKMATKLFEEAFKTDRKLVRHVFDGILAEDCKLHMAIINSEVDRVASLMTSEHLDNVDDGNRNFLHLLACWGMYHSEINQEVVPTNAVDDLKRKFEQDGMIRILNEWKSNEILQNSNDTILQYTPIDYAIVSRSFHIANKLCQKIKNSQIRIKHQDLNVPLLLKYCHIMDYPDLAGVIKELITQTN